jgi:hypothetical protein
MEALRGGRATKQWRRLDHAEDVELQTHRQTAPVQ